MGKKDRLLVGKGNQLGRRTRDWGSHAQIRAFGGPAAPPPPGATRGGGGIAVPEKVNLSFAGHWFRADKVPAGFSKEIGIEANLILTCSFSDSLSVLASVNRFFTGRFSRRT